MSNRIQYIDGVRLTEAMLNDSFGFLEQADSNLVADLGISGILGGLNAEPQQPIPDMSVTLTPGVAYDANGRRIRIDSAQTIDCSRSLQRLPVALVMQEHERWLTLCVAFSRLESEAVLDRYGHTVAIRQLESFRVVVHSGTETPIGYAERPTPGPDEVLICDVRMRHGQTHVAAADIDTARRHWPRLWKADYIQPESGHWKSLPAAQSVQAALEHVDAALLRQAEVLAHLVRGGSWKTLPDADSIQTALDAVDTALTQQAQVIANLLTPRPWKVLPEKSTVQTAMEAIDAHLNSQNQALATLQTLLTQATRHLRPAARRAYEVAMYTKDIAVPPLAPGQAWVQATHLDGIRALDRVISVAPALPDDAQKIRVIAVAVMEGTVRLQFTNLTQTTLTLSPRPYDIAVAVTEAP